jgi:hypothetical protein
VWGGNLPLIRRYCYRFLVTVTAAVITTLLFSPNARGDVRFDVGLNGGYTNNLFFDSSRVLDRHTTALAAVRYYPISWLELNISGDLSVYGEMPELSSRLGRVGFTAIPLGQDHKFAVSASGSYDGRRYRKALRDYDNNNFNTRLAIGYRFRPALAGRIGGTIQTTSYLASESGDKRSAEVFAGLNATVFRNNSFDIEFGYGMADYRTIDRSLKFIPIGPYGEEPEKALRDATLRSIYVSPRLSRPIGSKTGMNLTFLYRKFQNAGGALVIGSSVGLLSPWTSVWDGRSVTLTVKTYLIKTLTVSTGVGYWSKTYLQTLEQKDYPWVRGTGREDTQRRFYIQVTRPIAVWRDALLQPKIQVDYTRNSSTNELFDFSGFSIDTGISLQF